MLFRDLVFKDLGTIRSARFKHKNTHYHVVQYAFIVKDKGNFYDVIVVNGEGLEIGDLRPLQDADPLTVQCWLHQLTSGGNHGVAEDTDTRPVAGAGD